MAYVNGVYHPTRDDDYNPTGNEPGTGQLGVMASSVGSLIAGLRNDVDAVRYVHPGVTLNADLNDYTTPGVYPISSSAVAQSLVNGPPLAVVGTVTVSKVSTASGVVQQTAHLTSTATGGYDVIYVRRSVAGTFGPWEPSKWTMGRVPNGTDWNTVTAAGVYVLDVRSAAGTHTNLPPSDVTFAGVIEVLPISQLLGRVVQRATEYAAGVNSGRTWQRISNQDGTFTDWSVFGSSSGGATEGGSPYRHMMLQQAARKRRGGTYGSNGKTLVALRLDDSYLPMLNKVLPLLAERGIPASIAQTADEWHLAYNDVTWAQIQDAAINHGWEVWNHSNAHTDANTVAELEATIVGALATIRANMPKVVIDGFMPPGVGSAGTGYMGFMQGDRPEAFYDTPAGRIILDNHGLSAGHMETVVPLDGNALHGVMHLGLDRGSQVTTATNMITKHVGAGVGIVPMLHPYWLDETGRTTTARFAQFLDFLVGLRDAGDIDLVTVGTLMFADSGRSRRHDLAHPASWSAGEQTITFEGLEWAKGSVRELSAVGSGGSVTLTVTDDTGALNTTRTATPASGGLARLPFTIPADATSITCTVVGGTEPHVYAV